MNTLNHIAIIMDGNGRWAKERGKTRSEGHLEGAKNLEKIKAPATLQYQVLEYFTNFLQITKICGLLW